MGQITIGSDLSIDTVEALAKLQVRVAGRATNIRWRRPERLWLALANVEVPSAQMADLTDELSALAAALVPLTVSMGDWHWAEAKARCLGLTVDQGADLVTGAREVLVKRLEALGLYVQARPFVPWIFLGRTYGESKDLVLPKIGRVPPSHIDHFAIYGPSAMALGPARIQQRFFLGKSGTGRNDRARHSKR